MPSEVRARSRRRARDTGGPSQVTVASPVTLPAEPRTRIATSPVKSDGYVTDDEPLFGTERTFSHFPSPSTSPSHASTATVSPSLPIDAGAQLKPNVVRWKKSNVSPGASGGTSTGASGWSGG